MLMVIKEFMWRFGSAVMFGYLVGVANAVVMEAACDPFMCPGNRRMTSVKPST